MNPVLETTRYVLDRSKQVHINQEKLLEFAHQFNQSETQHWLKAAPFDFSKFSVEEKLNFIFLYNSISFSFWGEPKWSIEIDGKMWDGAWGMIKALGRGIEEGIPLLDFKAVAVLSAKELSQILRGNVEIPLFEERLNILHEIGTVMDRQFAGQVIQLVKEAQNSGPRLVNLIVDNFPSFKDVSTFQEKEICFYKRAQLLTTDIAETLNGTEFGSIGQMEELTGCADYKLPQFLRKKGILEYAPDFAQRIDSKIEIPHHSTEEIEIRAHTIWVIERMKQEIKKSLPGITAMQISDQLWLATQQKYPDDKPYHRTRTVAY